jgi:hypothetical protein
VFVVSHPAPQKAMLADGTASEIAALVPDGVQTVTLTLADDTTRTLPIEDNGAIATLSADPVSARFATDSGQRVVPLMGHNEGGQ